jgi:hypothetical protein
MIVENNKLTLNVLSFQHKHEQLTAYITPEDGLNRTRLSSKDRDFLSKYLQLPVEPEVLYSTFGEEVPNSFAVTMATSADTCEEGKHCWSFSFLKKYYSHLLANYFQSLGMPVKYDFVSDTQVWVKASSPYPNSTGYRVFTLRVQFNHLTKQPELVVMAGEIRSVLNTAISNSVFSEIPQGKMSWVLYKNNVYKFKYMPEDARRNMDDVFPCISTGLMHELKLKKPAAIKGNRYIKYWEEIEGFKNNYLLAERLLLLINIQQNWVEQNPKSLNASRFKPLQFGKGEHTEPKYGMKLGPKYLVTDEVVFFFVLHEGDKAMATTINDYLAGTKSDFKEGLYDYIKIRYNTVPNLSIVFQNKENPLPEIEQKLNEKFKNKLFDSSKRYVAIYLSPHSKWTVNVQYKAIYYQIKEALLNKGIVSQTIEVEKTWGVARKIDLDGKAQLNSNFHYSLPNILVAILAKLGGTPWSLERQVTDELVIGISAYRSRDLDRKYLGSAFSFTNEGRFQGFDCFRSNQTDELAGSILLAVKDYCEAHKTLERLVIHFYKNLSWKELKPIEKGLSELGLEVPVVVVSVNKNYSDDIIGFNLAQTHKMPYNGTYFSISNNQYLLYNNQLLGAATSLNEREGFPFPLKISMQKFAPSKKEVIQPEADESAALLDQVCRFSQLYWKSVSRQWMPVTLKYPEMLAQIVPHFKYADLSPMGKDSLWFL